MTVKKLNIAFLIDELPFPVTNGFALNSQHLIKHLAGISELSVFYLHGNHSEDSNFAFIPTKLNAYKRSTLGKFIYELTCKVPAYCKYKIDPQQIIKKFKDTPFDLIIISPAALVTLALDIKAHLGHKCPPIILAAHDTAYQIYLDECRRFIKGSVERTIRGLTIILRLPFIKRAELSYLRQMDAIQLQRLFEVQYLRHKLNKKSLIFQSTTGSNHDLSKIQYNHQNNTDILFLTHLVGGREVQALWFLKNVWPVILRAIPNCKLFIIGKPAPENLSKKIADIPNVIQLGFIHDLKEIFHDKCISIVPVNQTSGVVTKVLDSMAAGLPVVGFADALNTIEGFLNGIHGIAVDNKNDFASAVVQLIKNENLRKDISAHAREFILQKYNWEHNLIAWDNAINSILNNHA